MGTETPQSAQHVGDVGAEDAPHDVELVDDDERQLRQEVTPAGVTGEDADVEHVGVGEHDVGVAPHPRPGVPVGVAVVGGGLKARHPEPLEAAALIPGERLGRVDRKRRCALRRGQNCLGDRKLVAE